MGNIGVANAGAFGYSLTSLSGPYFMALYAPQNTTYSSLMQGGFIIDNSNNIYTLTISGSTYMPTVLKISQTGSLIFQKRYTNVYAAPYTGVLNSSGNIVLAAANTANPTHAYFVLDTSGNYLSGNGINAATGSSVGFYNVALDSSGNYHFVGAATISTYPNIIYAKYDSSFNLVSQQRYAQSTSSINGSGVACDSSGNVYLLSGDTISSVNYVGIKKVDSSGNIIWQYSYTGTGSQGGGNTNYPVVDSSGNIYFLITVTATYGKAFVVKIDSSGTVLWARRLGYASLNYYPSQISIDPSSSSIYVAGYGGTALNAEQYQIVKYDTSGNVIWKRSLGVSAVPNFTPKIIPKNNAYYIVGNLYINTRQNVFIAALPTDGTKTGTYSVGSSSYVYGVSTIVDEAASITRITSSLTKTTTSFASTAITKTVTDLTGTISTTAIT